MARTIARSLTTLALGGCALVSLPMTAAQAAPCEGYAPGTTCPANGEGQASTETAEAGATVTASGGGFAAGSEVEVYSCDGSLLGTATADSGGNVEATFTFPDDTPEGTCTVQLVGVNGEGGDNVLAVDFTITTDGAGAGGGLPFTGFEVASATLLGLGLVGGGAAFVVAGRKRKSATA